MMMMMMTTTMMMSTTAQDDCHGVCLFSKSITCIVFVLYLTLCERQCTYFILPHFVFLLPSPRDYVTETFILQAEREREGQNAIR